MSQLAASHYLSKLNYLADKSDGQQGGDYDRKHRVCSIKPRISRVSYLDPTYWFSHTSLSTCAFGAPACLPRSSRDFSTRYPVSRILQTPSYYPMLSVEIAYWIRRAGLNFEWRQIQS